MRNGSVAKPRVRVRLGDVSPGGNGTRTRRSARRSPTSRRTGFVETGGGPAKDISLGGTLPKGLAGRPVRGRRGDPPPGEGCRGGGRLASRQPTRRGQVAVAMLTGRPGA